VEDSAVQSRIPPAYLALLFLRRHLLCRLHVSGKIHVALSLVKYYYLDMPIHFQKWVTETIHWCGRCGKETRHRVSEGRLQNCLEHSVKVNERGENKTQQKRREERERKEKNPELF
jgi:hypothetical protein